MKPDQQLEDQFHIKLDELLAREGVITQKLKKLETEFSGLKDIDEWYELIELKFTICLGIMDHLSKRHPGEERGLGEIARNKAREAVRFLEDLIDQNISEDQKEEMVQAAGYKKARELLYQVLLKGGGVYFETKIEDKKKIKKIARIISAAIRKYTHPDDLYTPLFQTEKLSGIPRKLVDMFLPIFGKPHQKPPPYGIEEGEEVFYSSKKIQLPLSQGIYYLENEVLPQLKQELKENPHDREIQKQLHSAEQKLLGFKEMKFIPRSSPLFPEKGYYSEGLTSYTRDGEMLITFHIPVIYRSGTNLERMQELVCAEITRNLAGKGFCPELDKEYEYLKRIESGKKGNSRIPSLKLNTSAGFKMLKNLYPFLAKLEHKQTFKKLLGVVKTTDRKYSIKLIGQLIGEDDYKINALP